MITFDDWAKIEIKIGTILAAERVPETDKLWKLTVELGEETPRTIVSGIAPNYPEAAMLVGKQCPFIVNLEPRMIKGIESNGMILAPSDDEGKGVVMHPERTVASGAKVK
jgi:methionyl-tRNA synthetase